MKKMSLVVVGLAVVIGAVVLVGRQRTQGSQGLTTEHTENTEAVRVPSGDESRRDGGGTAQGSALRGGTDGQSGQSAPQSELSAPVQALLGLDGEQHNYPSLLSAINDLGVAMSADDIAALMEMLDFPNDRFPEGMRPIEINAVKNDTLDKLLRQKHLPEGLGLQMVAMAGDGDHDPVWRDYCIQFMTPFYERAAGERGTTEYAENTESIQSEESVQSADELAAVRDAMFSALDERDATLAGTSLIGLELLSRTHDEFDREVIVTKSVEIASDEMASAASRMTALRLSASGNWKLETGNLNDVTDAARALAQTGETVLLRSAAIVTLGEVGTPADRELLVSYTTDDNRQIADAARMALEKMDQEPSVELEVASKSPTKPQATEKLPPVLIN